MLEDHSIAAVGEACGGGLPSCGGEPGQAMQSAEVSQPLPSRQGDLLFKLSQKATGAVSPLHEGRRKRAPRRKRMRRSRRDNLRFSLKTTGLFGPAPFTSLPGEGAKKAPRRMPQETPQLPGQTDGMKKRPSAEASRFHPEKDARPFNKGSGFAHRPLAPRACFPG